MIILVTKKSERSDSDDYRNGYKSKRVNSSYGSMDIDVPQDRKSTFEPQIVKKRQKDITTMVSSFVAEWYGEVRSGIMNEG